MFEERAQDFFSDVRYDRTCLDVRLVYVNCSMCTNEIRRRDIIYHSLI